MLAFANVAEGSELRDIAVTVLKKLAFANAINLSRSRAVTAPKMLAFANIIK